MFAARMRVNGLAIRTLPASRWHAVLLTSFVAIAAFASASIAEEPATPAKADQRPPASAADVTKVNLFEARTGGYHTYRIPGIVVSPRGTLLAWAEARKTGTGDWEDIDILLRRSHDHGATWDPPRIIADVGTSPAHNAVAIVDPSAGVIHLLYCVGYQRAFYCQSIDDGATFSPPTEITTTFRPFQNQFLWNVIATGPGHGLRLKNGRLLVSVWLSNGGRRHRPSAVGVIYSDDQGATWQAGELIPNTLINMSEATLVERTDGSVLMNIRHEDREHRRAVSTSKDGVRGWSRPEFDTQLLEPVCMGSLLRLNWPTAESKGTILFANPDNIGYSGKHGASHDQNRDRVNLTIKVSHDDCQTWSHQRVLEPGVAAYSDLATDDAGNIYCCYERDGVNGSMWDIRYITVARFTREWLQTPAEAQSADQPSKK